MFGRDRGQGHGDDVKGEEDLGRAVARLEPARGQRAAGAASHEPAVVGEGGDGEQVVAMVEPAERGLERRRGFERPGVERIVC